MGDTANQNEAAESAKVAADAKAAADAKVAAAAKAAADAKPKRHTAKPSYAIHKINGTIEPGTLFRPADADEHQQLLDLGAIRDLTDAEESLFKQTGEGTVADEDPLG